jgi:Ca2+-binding RTX toxin-like protein
MYYGATIEVLTGSAGNTTNGLYSAGAFAVGQTIHLQNNPGNKPTSLALGDFNGDGVPDLVLGYFYNNSIAILPGTSAGSFATTPLPRVAVGRGPDAIAVGDLNGDGDLDLVVANKFDGTISILMGEGNGQFLPQRVYKVGNDPTSVAIADVNGDGIPDIVVTNAGDNTVSVLVGNPSGTGNGRGTFQPAKTFATGPGPVSVQVADLNGDGFSDLVTANATGDSISVLLGNGDGTFQAHQDVALGESPASIATGSATSVTAPNASALAEVRQDVFVAATGAATSNPNAVYGSQVLVLPNINTNQANFSLQGGLLNLTGTAGNDTISLTEHGQSVIAQINDLTKTYPIGSVGQADIAGLAGNDSITFDSTITFPINAGGQGGNDTLIASNAANDTLSGGRGADSLVGGSGNNFISGGAGNDTLVAGSGNDTLRGSGGNDSLNGRGGGNDYLAGGPGSDSLLGTLVSGSDMDTLIGGAGSDSLVAGPRDHLVLPGTGGDDTVVGP